MIINIPSTLDINVPEKTKVISSEGDFLTLAIKKPKGVVWVWTGMKTELSGLDLTNEANWTEFTSAELKKLAAL